MNTVEYTRKMAYLKKLALRIYKSATPVNTGYQKEHIFINNLPNGGFEVYVDTEYVQYTTDKWASGLNPNEGWEEEAGKEFVKQAKVILSGSIKK